VTGVSPQLSVRRGLETERLVLEPLEPRHAAEMVAVLADPDLYRHTGGQPPSDDELRRRYELQARGHSADGTALWLNWIVRERSTGAAAGFVQATVVVASGTADVAWVVGVPFQGRGYAREAAGAMVDRLREEGVERVTAHIHPDNVASQRVARALGLAPTTTVVDGEVRWEAR
jgi:RimJ/RimL family protein N-acetyltransferase